MRKAATSSPLKDWCESRATEPVAKLSVSLAPVHSALLCCWRENMQSLSWLTATVRLLAREMGTELLPKRASAEASDGFNMDLMGIACSG